MVGNGRLALADAGQYPIVLLGQRNTWGAWLAIAGALGGPAGLGLLLGFAGVLASAAQYSLTRAYQLAPASLNAAVNYLVPVLNLGWSVLLFAKVPDASALLGCGLILVCGVCLPLLQARRVRAAISVR